MHVAKVLAILLSINSSYAFKGIGGAAKVADDVPVGAGVKGAVSGAVSAASKAEADALQAGKQAYAGITGGYKPATSNEVAGAKPIANNGASSSKAATSNTASGSKPASSDGTKGAKTAAKAQPVEVDMNVVRKEFDDPSLDAAAVRQLMQYLITYTSKGPKGASGAIKLGVEYAKKAALKFPGKCPNPKACNPFHGIQMSDAQRQMGYRIINHKTFKEAPLNPKQVGGRAGPAGHQVIGEIEGLLANYLSKNDFKLYLQSQKLGRQGLLSKAETLRMTQLYEMGQEAQALMAKFRQRGGSYADLRRADELLHVMPKEFKIKTIKDNFDEIAGKLKTDLEVRVSRLRQRGDNEKANIVDQYRMHVDVVEKRLAALFNGKDVMAWIKTGKLDVGSADQWKTAQESVDRIVRIRKAVDEGKL